MICCEKDGEPLRDVEFHTERKRTFLLLRREERAPWRHHRRERRKRNVGGSVARAAPTLTSSLDGHEEHMDAYMLPL